MRGNKEELKKYLLLGILIFILSILLIRILSEKHLDDLHPEMPCDKYLIEKSDYLSVIPIYNNVNISENKEWCNFILSFNKTIIMHGVYHTFNEFNEERDYQYINRGIKEFNDCFGFYPTEFKPPQLALSKKNKIFLEKEFGFKVHTWFSQRFHKVYHCNDSGMFPNWLADII